MIETFEFKNIEELFDYLSPWGESPKLDGYIFRGQSQESHKLIPTALRPGKVEDFWKVCGLGKPIDQQCHWQTWQVKAEYQILRSFYRLADQRGLEVPISSRVRENLAQEFDIMGVTNYHSKETWIPDDLLETAALAQHYGIPTRLLDWTYDIYVALYFAFRGALNKENNLVIWALNKEYLSFLKPTVNRINIEFITPHYAGNPNLNAQKGLFTHWPVSVSSIVNEMQDMQQGQVTLVDRTPLYDLIKVQLKQEEKPISIFKKIVLPCSEAAKGCGLLDKLGYDSARIFPGYAGVAEQLLSRHKYS